MTKEIEKALQGKQPPLPPPAETQLPAETLQSPSASESAASDFKAEMPEIVHDTEAQSSQSQPGLREFWVALLSDLEPAHDRLEIFSGVKSDEQQPAEKPQPEPQPQQVGAAQAPSSGNDTEKWFKYLPWVLGGILVLGGLAIWLKNKFARGEDDSGGGGNSRPRPKTPPEMPSEQTPERSYDGDYYKHVLETLYSK